MSNCLNEHLVPIGYNVTIFLDRCIYIKHIEHIMDILKMFGYWVNFCHYIVVFLAYLKVAAGSGYPGNCNRVPGS